MPHTPWPENGCTLAEARERTADRVGWKEWNDRIADYRAQDVHILKHLQEGSRSEQLKQAVNEREKKINSDFGLQLRARQLVAYGRPGKPSAAPQLIADDIWPPLTAIEWEQSTAGKKRSGSAVFHEVRVYPSLLAPCRVDLVRGLSLSAAFQKFVLEDPEFVALARHAVKFDKAVYPMLQEGQFARGWSFSSQWPIDLTPFPNFADVINDAHSFGERVSVTSEKSREACEVLRDRYMRLLSLVKCGSVVARGTYVLSGRVEEIDVAQWSRPSGWIDTRSGDLLDEIDNKLVARWTGLTFSAPGRSSASGRPDVVAPIIIGKRVDSLQTSVDAEEEEVTNAATKKVDGGGLQLAVDAKTMQIVVHELLRLGDADSKLVLALHDPFKQDLSDGRSPENYQYVTSHKLAEILQIDEPTVRQRVARCRTAVRDAYKRKFGQDPPEHLLIENKARQGYRLNPYIRFVAIGEIYSTATSHGLAQSVTILPGRR